MSASTSADLTAVIALMTASATSFLTSGVRQAFGNHVILKGCEGVSRKQESSKASQEAGTMVLGMGRSAHIMGGRLENGAKDERR